jgi:hypothetical protein
MSDINMTPLIDVMLVLLVIFMITAPLMTSSLKLDLPRSDASRPTDNAMFITVAVDSWRPSSSLAAWQKRRGGTRTPKCNCVLTAACRMAAWLS